MGGKVEGGIKNGSWILGIKKDPVIIAPRDPFLSFRGKIFHSV